MDPKDEHHQPCPLSAIRRVPVEDEDRSICASVDGDSGASLTVTSSNNSADHSRYSSSGDFQHPMTAVTLGAHDGISEDRHNVEEDIRLAIHRIASLETRLDMQERVNAMTQQELMDARNQIAELDENPKTTVQMHEQLKTLRDKTDLHLSKLERDKDKLLAENKELRQAMLDRALEQAETERNMLAEFDRKMEDKLAELRRKLQSVSEERDQARKEVNEAKLQESILQHEKETLKRDRDNWRKRSVETGKENQTKSDQLAEKTELSNQKDKILVKFEEQCEIVSKQNRRLRRENSFLKETLFRVVRVGSNTLSDALSDATTNASPDVVFECYSCRTSYTSTSQKDNINPCQFHPLPAMQYREWSRWPIGKSADESERNKLYWPCCDKLSYSRPTGCSEGRHHQSWERDILMKKALSAKDNLNWD